VAAFTRLQFADLARATRLAGTFAFLERLVKADFSACGDLYIHRATIARLLTPWFARHTTAEVAAALAGTTVPWARLDLTSRPGPDTEQEEWDDRQSRDPRVGSGPGLAGLVIPPAV
jgi:2-methylfumaryl-CoA isomerase